MDRMFGLMYVQGYTSALLDVQATFTSISVDLKIHKRRWGLKTVLQIIGCMVENRAILRENPQAFVRCAKDGGYEVYIENRGVYRRQLLEGQGMKFASVEHQKFFEESLAQIMRRWGKDDCYHRALFYLLGLMEETRQHIGDLFAFDNDNINPEELDAAWQTGGTIRLCRLAFNLWNGYVEEGEDEEFSPSDLFACSLAPYFVVALKLRFPEYFAGKGVSMLSEDRG